MKRRVLTTMLLLISGLAFSSRNNTVEIVGALIIMLDWIKILDSTYKIKQMPNDALLVRINLKNQRTFQISVSKLAGSLWTSIHFLRVIT